MKLSTGNAGSGGISHHFFEIQLLVMFLTSGRDASLCAAADGAEEDYLIFIEDGAKRTECT